MPRALRLSLLAIFMALHVCAVVYTVTGIGAWRMAMPLIAHLRMVMGPFAGLRTYNQEFIVEGLQDDAWHVIDMSAYLPVLRREQTNRLHLNSWRSSPDLRAEKYRFLLSMIMAREQGRGRMYRAVRLRHESWPVSPEGTDANRIAPLTKSVLYMTYPSL